MAHFLWSTFATAKNFLIWKVFPALEKQYKKRPKKAIAAIIVLLGQTIWEDERAQDRFFTLRKEKYYVVESLRPKSAQYKILVDR